jgi:phosphate:Na+ symporter
MGFSFMFLGLNYMKNGFAEFAEHIDFSFLSDKHPMLFVVMGLVLSASIQSSSAAMMIFLSSLAAGVITLHQGFYLVVGGDLGTTTTAIIGTINGNSIKKKVGWSQVSFNVFNATVALIIMNVYVYLILDVLKVKDDLIGLVVFHSLLNLTGIVLLLPFLNKFSKVLDRIIKVKESNLAKYLMLTNPHESHAATEALEKECISFLPQAINVNNLFFELNTQGKKTVSEAYFALKAYESEVVNFYIQLQQNALSPEEVNRINNFVASIRNATLSAKDLKDIKHNLDELSNSAIDQFYDFYKKNTLQPKAILPRLE